MKNLIRSCRAPVWAASSSEVAASSSLEEAFCCVILAIWAMAVLIWAAPEDCSPEAAEIILHEGIRGLGDAGDDLLEQGAGPLGRLDTAAGQLADLLSGDLATLSQFAYFGLRRRRRSPAVLADTGGLR